MIEFEAAGSVAHITLNRPEARNALDPAALLALESCWARVRDDPDIRAAVLSAKGPAFCNGADLRALIPVLSGAAEAGDAVDWTALREIFARGPLFTVRDQGKPVVAAIQGDAFGGGLELILAADIVVVARGARLGFPEVRFGLAPTGLCIPRLLARAPGVATRLLLTGDPLSAEAALAAGLVDEVVEASEVGPRATAIASQVAANGPLAVQSVRRTARAASGLDSPALWDLARALARDIFASEDAREGPAAYAARRAPNFTGR